MVRRNCRRPETIARDNLANSAKNPNPNSVEEIPEIATKFIARDSWKGDKEGGPIYG